MILFIDNYDSFTYNLVQMIGQICPDIVVRRNDAVTLDEIEAMAPDAIILSPGPGYPSGAGVSVETVRRFSGRIPILGVCLGHQAIVEAFGGRIIPARELMHGKASAIKMEEQHPLFQGLPCPFMAGRYHSLIADESCLPEALYVTALDENGQIMGVSHRTHKTYGVQFHPESVLTGEGATILRNFLVCAGLAEHLPTKEEARKGLQYYYSKLMQRQDLTLEESQACMEILMSGEASQLQIAAVLMSLATKGETPVEIAGFAKGMRAKATLVPDAADTIDIVGTGGDKAFTFNISTTSAFVAAAGGAKVAKHGNRSVSSKSGAADVLEALGAKIATTPQQAKTLIDKAGLSFLFAQSYHASMRFVGPVRGQLGVRTVFNVLGPLTNPARADYIVLGVYDKSMTQVMARVLREVGIRHAMVVFGNDVMDEISASDATTVTEVRDGELIDYEITPEQFGLTRCKKEDIVGGTPQENAKITRGILSGEIQGPKRNIVLLNAGAALYTYGITPTLEEGVAMAAELIDSGKALEKLEEFVRLTNEME
ncbi:MAG: bifunctional anthranilate synthase component II/anthranilate phosphoribosyltransferase [Oscillospiraceae bacterium]|nr:bifunctional anthranilate synthase component II/anthranilate phosphoribosyltransferase [Oscillospiraceae bacterium]